MTASYSHVDLSNPTEVYERWLVEPLFRPSAVRLIEQTGIDSHDRVLDTACGTGIVARLAAERVLDPRRVTGIDNSINMLRVARRIAPAIDWREGDAGNLPLAIGERFEVVFCHQGLQLFSNLSAALHEMHRALVPGGRLGLATWSTVPEGSFLHDLHLVAEHYLGPLVDRRHLLGTEADLHHLATDAGFREVWVDSAQLPVIFPDVGVFLQLNVRALMGMSPNATAMTEAERVRVALRMIEESHAAAGEHTTADGLAFTIGSVLATARR